MQLRLREQLETLLHRAEKEILEEARQGNKEEGNKEAYETFLKHKETINKLLPLVADLKSHEVRKANKTIYRYKLTIHKHPTGRWTNIEYTPETSFATEAPNAIRKLLEKVAENRKIKI